MARELLGWQHRFDDPQRKYRTLYCAQEPATCLREVLADLRPSARMLAEYGELFGATAARRLPAGVVSARWRERHVLASGRLVLAGALTDVDDVDVRERLKHEHAALLAEHGMQQLDISEVRSRARIVTQTISRSLFEDGVAAIRFRSNLDDLPCLALFEGRARLEQAGAQLELTESTEALVQVCREFGLRLE